MQATGLWKKLAKLKHVVQEPRTGGNEGLQKVMAEYYGAISRGEGGLFMAVCRGKVGACDSGCLACWSTSLVP